MGEKDGGRMSRKQREVGTWEKPERRLETVEGGGGRDQESSDRRGGADGQRVLGGRHSVGGFQPECTQLDE